MPGENEEVKKLEAQLADLEAQMGVFKQLLDNAAVDNPDLAKALELQEAALAKVEELTTALEKATADAETLKAELELANTMTDREKAYVKATGMAKGDLPPWLKKPKKDRDDEMDKADKAKAANDETVTISGRTISKSVVGDDVFAIMKAQAEDIAKGQATLAKEVEKREMAELTKRADDEFGSVPGTSEERAKMLREIGKMEEPLRKAFEAVFTQSEKLAKGLFEKVGTKGGDLTPEAQKLAKAAADFEAKADAIKVAEKCSETQAIQKARKAHPELFKAYQEHGEQRSASN